jgi:hypothetical protein
MKRIASIKQLRTKRLLGAKQDGSREFVSLLATICADGTALPPALIYQGESGDLQDSWLEDYDDSSIKAHFAVSSKGWTNENLGISWLDSVFNRYTKKKAGSGWRLLIMDGHSSHLNMRFIDYCESHRIIAAVLPPHSTHRLQPLDVGIFSPLATAYSKEIDQLVQRSHGFSRITKRTFWPLFYAAWTKSLTKANIQSAFEATGIEPFNPEKTVSQVQRKTPSPSPDPTDPKTETPGSVRAVRRMTKEITKGQDTLNHQVKQLVKASEKLAISNEILAHENRDLRSTLISEKRRRKKGKAMGLLDPDQPGQAQFFSPTKVGLARQRAAEIEQQKEQNRIEIEERRIERENKKKEKAEEAEERKKLRLQAREKKCLARELKQREREEAKLRKLVNEQVSGDKKTSKKSPQASISPKTCEKASTGSKSPERSKRTSARSGRNIQPPRRYEDYIIG